MKGGGEKMICSLNDHKHFVQKQISTHREAKSLEDRIRAGCNGNGNGDDLLKRFYTKDLYGGTNFFININTKVLPVTVNTAIIDKEKLSIRDFQIPLLGFNLRDLFEEYVIYSSYKKQLTTEQRNEVAVTQFINYNTENKDNTDIKDINQYIDNDNFEKLKKYIKPHTEFINLYNIKLSDTLTNVYSDIINTPFYIDGITDIIVKMENDISSMEKSDDNDKDDDNDNDTEKYDNNDDNSLRAQQGQQQGQQQGPTNPEQKGGKMGGYRGGGIRKELNINENNFYNKYFGHEQL